MDKTTKKASRDDVSPFHAGEQELQSRVGKRESMDNFGRQVIRPHMPEQHRLFYQKLPFLVVGSVDIDGWPWASILAGRPGFIQSPDSSRLQVNAAAIVGDPLGEAIGSIDAPLGLLGIETETRRRNRMNGRILKSTLSGFEIKVDQAFGNCPQYLQSRSLNFVRELDAKRQGEAATRFSDLDEDARAMIANADTFFVSSYLLVKDRPEIEGVDVSHRGGRPGFVKVDGNTLTIPEFPGNNYFNTLGNFLLNPKAGLIFADFATGEILLLTGTVELLWDQEADIQAFKGAERAWRFTLDHGIRIKEALPFTLTFGDYSPNTLITGDWAQAAETLAAEAKRDAWRPYRITRVEDESAVIRSFYLQPTDGDGLPSFEAGQFLTIQVQPPGSETPSIRTYTVSSAPGESFYRISVKKEPEGLVSNYLHDALAPGDLIQAKAPSGNFLIDATEARPAVLIAGGVGITPMMSMTQHIANEGLRTRYIRPLSVIHSARSTEQRAFHDAFRSLECISNGGIRYYSFISQPSANENPGVDFHGSGYITVDVLRQLLHLDDYDFYLCGPPAFMQAIYDSLRDLGVNDVRIKAEAFGPASLKRKDDELVADLNNQPEEAEQAVIKFAKSGFEQSWSAGDATLLETAEAHGLAPEFSCRNGICGSCATKLQSGSISYRTKPSAAHADDQVLICCAVPAKGSGTVELEL